MGYNKLRYTISKKDCECSVCNKKIKKDESVYLIPGKYIAHAKCNTSLDTEKILSFINEFDSTV